MLKTINLVIFIVLVPLIAIGQENKANPDTIILMLNKGLIESREENYENEIINGDFVAVDLPDMRAYFGVYYRNDKQMKEGGFTLLNAMTIVKGNDGKPFSEHFTFTGDAFFSPSVPAVIRKNKGLTKIKELYYCQKGGLPDDVNPCLL